MKKDDKGTKIKKIKNNNKERKNVLDVFQNVWLLSSRVILYQRRVVIRENVATSSFKRHLFIIACSWLNNAFRYVSFVIQFCRKEEKSMEKQAFSLTKCNLQPEECRLTPWSWQTWKWKPKCLPNICEKKIDGTFYDIKQNTCRCKSV